MPRRLSHANATEEFLRGRVSQRHSAEAVDVSQTARSDESICRSYRLGVGNPYVVALGVCTFCSGLKPRGTFNKRSLSERQISPTSGCPGTRANEQSRTVHWLGLGPQRANHSGLEWWAELIPRVSIWAIDRERSESGPMSGKGASPRRRFRALPANCYSKRVNNRGTAR